MPRTGRIGKAPAISPSPTSDKYRHNLAATFGYAFTGLGTAWRTQPNVRIHSFLALAVLIAGLLLHLPPFAWALVILAIALVLVAELSNTAVEALVDLASPEEHPLAKQAKDVAASAVLVASVAAATVGVLVAVWALSRP